MEQTFWEYLINTWKKTYYTQPLWVVCSIIALITGLYYYQKEKSHNLLIIYSLSSILLPSTGYWFIKYFFSLRSPSLIIYLESSNTLFAVIEITTFLYLFKKLLNTEFISRIIYMLWIVFTSLCVLLFSVMLKNKFSPDQISHYSFLLEIFELFILLLLCLLFFYKLLTTDISRVIPISKSPSFWIISGLFFYCIVSLPLLLIGYRLYISNPHLHLVTGSIHYISISFLFLCITKAFLCKTTLTI